MTMQITHTQNAVVVTTASVHLKPHYQSAAAIYDYHELFYNDPDFQENLLQAVIDEWGDNPSQWRIADIGGVFFWKFF